MWCEVLKEKCKNTEEQMWKCAGVNDVNVCCECHMQASGVVGLSITHREQVGMLKCTRVLCMRMREARERAKTTVAGSLWHSRMSALLHQCARYGRKLDESTSARDLCAMRRVRHAGNSLARRCRYSTKRTLRQEG